MQRLDPRFKAIRISDLDEADDLTNQADLLDAAAADAQALRQRSDGIRADMRRTISAGKTGTARVTGAAQQCDECTAPARLWPH